MENKWCPCWCCILLGALVIVFAWWKVAWGAIALTVLGALVLIQGIVGKCCCRIFGKKKEGEGCCT